jgi:hypothetical protein
VVTVGQSPGWAASDQRIELGEQYFGGSDVAQTQALPMADARVDLLGERTLAPPQLQGAPVVFATASQIPSTSLTMYPRLWWARAA